MHPCRRLLTGILENLNDSTIVISMRWQKTDWFLYHSADKLSQQYCSQVWIELYITCYHIVNILLMRELGKEINIIKSQRLCQKNSSTYERTVSQITLRASRRSRVYSREREREREFRMRYYASETMEEGR